jgi:prepilin-type N-terminal cleavage/methylation domain-containing protein
MSHLSRASLPSPQLRRASFTLIELLVVIAIVAILSVVVIIALNPTELLRQARDSNRLSDLNNLNTALNIYQVDIAGGSLGSASTTYISIADPAATSTAGTQCQGLGLSTSSLPSGWSYHCAASSTLRKANGTGWLPVNFTAISSGAPLGTLPIDPTNTTSSGQYYTYTPGGSWELTAGFESQKYVQQEATDGGVDPAMYETGSNLTLSPFTHGMVGYWSFEEGTGATALDSSGNRNTGTWYGTGTHYATGKAGSYAAQFATSTLDYVEIASSTSLSLPGNNETVMMWVKYVDNGNIFVQLRNWSRRLWSTAWSFYDANNTYYSLPFSLDGNWHHFAYTFSNQTASTYKDGVAAGSSSFSANLPPASDIWRLGRSCGGSNCDLYYSGLIDEVRIYNRALSAAEILAIYNATK